MHWLKIIALGTLIAAALALFSSAVRVDPVDAREALGYPFDPGQTWEVTRGYNCIGCSSHNPAGYPPWGVTDAIALDLVKVEGDTAGQNVRAVFKGDIVKAAPVNGPTDYSAGCRLILRGDDKREFFYAHVDTNPPGSNTCAASNNHPDQGEVIGKVHPASGHLHVQWCDKDWAGCSDSQGDAVPLNKGVFCFPEDASKNHGNGEWEGYRIPPGNCTDGGDSPTADAGGPYPGVVGEPIQFDATGSDPGGPEDHFILHEWDWDCDGTYDSEIIAKKIWHTYDSPYSGCVRLRVTNTHFLTDTDTAHVEVRPPNRPPIAEANGDPEGKYYTDEGTNWPLDGTGSSDPDGDALTYAWDLDDDGFFDDSTSATPMFTMVGQDGNFAVHLRVSDGELSAEDGATVVVRNVPPSVSLGSDAPKDEGSAVTVSGTVTDPGWLDPLWAEIYWGDGTPPEPVGGVLENVRPDATLTFSVSHVYGDNGVFTAEVCAHDDDTTTCETIDLQVDNVDPTAEIDESGAVLVNGVPTFIAHIGEPLDFSGRSTDPGSDDLYLSWDWGDGSPVVTTTYLVNPPNPDPFPSPSIQPRDVTDAQPYTYANACLYEVRFWAEDDDGGMSPVDTANVVIVGNADEVRSAGYWQHQFRSHLTGRGHSDFDEPTLQCYLAISGYMSQVFDEERDASTFDLAHDVLFVKQNGGSMEEIFDRQLLAVWLNFANGSIELDDMVDTNGDGTPDTTFWNAVIGAEAVRLDPSATRWQLEQQKNILERVNMMGG